MKALTSVASSAANRFSVTFAAPMLAEESQALAEVAGIGFERLRRQPPLGAQMRQPARHLQREAFVGAVEFDRLKCRNWLGHEPYALEAVIPIHYIAPLSFTVR